eukprot:3077275-Pleurochrysis_carterae.AAC.1
MGDDDAASSLLPTSSLQPRRLVRRVGSRTFDASLRMLPPPSSLTRPSPKRSMLLLVCGVRFVKPVNA